MMKRCLFLLLFFLSGALFAGNLQIEVIENLDQRSQADLIVLPYWKADTKPKAAFKGEESEQILCLLESGDFKGNVSDIVFLYSNLGSEPRIALIGLGEEKELTMQTLRLCFSTVIKEARKRKLESINIVLPETDRVGQDLLCKSIAEGMLLTNYSFERYKTPGEERAPSIATITLIGASTDNTAICQRTQVIVNGVNLARDLINGNADDITPEKIGDAAVELSKENEKIKTTVFDKAQIEKEKMGLLLAVNRGACNEPRFIMMEYYGNPESQDVTAIVGKGITYDTGGLNLKPTGGMETMKCDMSGAAAVLGTMKTIAALGLKVNVLGVIPTTENAIGCNSYKPGDVYISYSGKTVEIGNTDAEGRLVLADAVSYTVKTMKPTRIIDLATLTGAIVVSLGEEASGLFSNNDELCELLRESGESTYERVWRMPTYPEYKEQLKSAIADLKNIGGKQAQSITAALFIEAFVENTPWAHLDIAGTAYTDKPKNYNTTPASGVGVRLLTEMFERLEKQCD
jgi:leucyl aminopeptidase